MAGWLVFFVDSARANHVYSAHCPCWCFRTNPRNYCNYMTARKINIAIVGLGFGAEFIPIYQRHPDANMYAICQRNAKKLDAIGDAFGVEKRYTDSKNC